MLFRPFFLGIVVSASLALGCEQPYDRCMDEVAAQTDTPKEDLKDLHCADLVGMLSLPEDYIVFQGENAVSIIHCSLPLAGSSLLQHNQLCYEQIRELLGIQPITQCVLETLVFDGDAQDFIEQYVSSGAAGCMMIHSVAAGKKRQCQKPEQELHEPESCSPHEPTHIFVAGTVLDQTLVWLNEGLADYVMTTLQDNKTLECFPDGFRYVYLDSGTGEVRERREGKYVPLDKRRKEHQETGTTLDAYLTGACLWQHIDRTYGSETFKAIMQDVQDSRLTPMSFINDILLRHIGENGIYDLEQKLGKDSIDAYR